MNTEILPVHVVADSATDIPTELVKKWDIDIVSANIIFSATEQYIDDGIDITRADFFNKLATYPKIPSTSSPGPKPFMNIFNDHPGPIAVVDVGSKLSGFYDHGVIATRALNRTNIESCDTGSASLGAGFPALLAAELAKERYPLSEIMLRIDDVVKRTGVLALAAELKYLQKSGRIPLPASWLGSLLSLKPIFQVKDNRASPIDVERTTKKALVKFYALILKHAPFEQIGIVHANNLPLAEEVQNTLSNYFDKEKMIVTDLTPGVANQVGPGAVGVVFVEQEKPAKV